MTRKIWLEIFCASALILVSFVAPAPSSAQTAPQTAAASNAGGLQTWHMDAAKPKPAEASSFLAVLLGGHGDVDAALKLFCAHTGGGDIVVLRASGDDDMDPYFHQLCPENSVTTLLITSEAGATNPIVTRAVRQAHGIYISGGDQSNYVKMWSDNSLQQEINAAIRRGTPIAGISAGLAVLGEFSFSSLIDTITSPEALANPYDPKVTLERQFLDIPVLRGVITDSHFSARQRMGRSITFLSRIVQDGWAADGRGIGIDETTAVVVDADGQATVMGEGSAYFMDLDHRPESCAPHTPLTVRGVEVYKLSPGAAARFDLKSWKGTGGTASIVDVVQGRMETRSLAK